MPDTHVIQDIQPAPPYLAGLNAAQREAAIYGAGPGGEHAPLLILAGAGTGKTSTLAHRVAYLVDLGANPERILLLTFSRRAADELSRRVQRIAGGASPRHARLVGDGFRWSGTFHAIGARLLREYAGRIGLDPAFTIHDREDSADLMNLVRHDLALSGQGQRFPLKGTCLAIYSSVINTQSTLEEVLQHTFPWCSAWAAELKALFLGYVEAKQAQQVLDYDDLLLYWAQMLEDADLAAEIGARFDHVLVDEYQDTNRLQATILLALKPAGHGVTVVGDEAQSIYRFRGASVRNILDFPDCFSPPARRITLEQNYRSTPPILEAANAVIALSREGYGKALWSERSAAGRPRLVALRDEADQAVYVVNRVLERREQGIALKAQAVLFRTAAHSARLEVELTRRNVPFVKYGGLKFLEARHIKDFLALLRWAQNLRDRLAGFRAVQLLPGIGPKIAGRILDNLGAAPPGCALLAEQPVPEALRPVWTAFAGQIEALAERGRWPAPLEAAAQWYEAQMERLFDDAEVRRADIRQLVGIAATYPNAERFLTELTLDPPDATSDEAGVPLRDEDYLILSTIHSAKGKEWRAVSLLNCVDGCLPSDLATGSEEEIEEERRLLYVAMTRAQDHLELLVPQRFYTTGPSGGGDRHVYASRTRFIAQRLLPQFEQISWPPPPDIPGFQSGGSGTSGEGRVDLAARMRAMWK